METERYRRRSSSMDEFDTSLMYDDIEKIREIEEEEEKDQNSKLSFAGMMALVAGVTLFATVLLTGTLPASLGQFLTLALMGVGLGALGYGFYKTVKLVFRQKELSFPALNVYRKTKPISVDPEQTRTRGKTASAYSTASESQTRYRRPRQRTYQRRKTLMRSRSNRVFAGVAAGIAEYLNISPALVRFTFIAFMFVLLPLSPLTYLLLSIVLPTDFSSGYREKSAPGTGSTPRSS